MLGVKTIGKRKPKVQITLSDGDYNLLRMILEDTSQNSLDANIRDYIASKILPLLPKNLYFR
jgi:hypothetical protein